MNQEKRKVTSTSCFNLYFKQSFLSWVHCNHPNINMSDAEIINIARKMWEGMTEEQKKNGFIKDGDAQFKFNLTSSVKDGSKNHTRFLEEKNRVIQYMHRNAGALLDKFSKLSEKPMQFSPSKRVRDSIDDLEEYWEGFNKLGADDFGNIIIFETEAEILELFQQSCKNAIKEKNSYSFINFQQHLNSQLQKIKKVTRDLKKDLSLYEEKCNDINEKIEELSNKEQIINIAISKCKNISDTVHNNVSNIMTSINDFNESEFIDLVIKETKDKDDDSYE